MVFGTMTIGGFLMSKKEKMVVYIEGVVFTLEIIGLICKYHQLRLMLLDTLSYFFSSGGNSDATHFQWVGVTAFLAVIGFFINIRETRENRMWERRKLSVDIKNKNSIIWIDKVRDLLGEYISVSKDTLMSYADLQINATAHNMKWETLRGIYNSNLKSSVKYASLLFLYIPSNDSETFELVENITQLTTVVQQGKNEIKNADLNRKEEMAKEFEQTFTEFVNNTLIPSANIYFENEWKKATKD